MTYPIELPDNATMRGYLLQSQEIVDDLSAGLTGPTGRAGTVSYMAPFTFQPSNAEERAELIDAARDIPAVTIVDQPWLSAIILLVMLEGCTSASEPEHTHLCEHVWARWLRPALRDADVSATPELIGGAAFISDATVIAEATGRLPLDNIKAAIEASQAKEWASYNTQTQLDPEHLRITANLDKHESGGYWADAGTLADIPHRGIYVPVPGRVMLFARGAGTLYVVSETHNTQTDNWTRLASGRLATTYNALPTLEQVAKIITPCGETAAGIIVDTFIEAAQVVAMFGKVLPPFDNDRDASYTIEQTNDKICVTTKRTGTNVPKGWSESVRNLKFIFSLPETDTPELVRKVVRQNGHADDGVEWQIKQRNGRHARVSYREAQDFVARSIGKKADKLLLQAQNDPWVEVNEPLQRVTGRRINVGAQFVADPEPGPYPFWQSIFDHGGRGLDRYIDDRCRDMGIRSGADYLFARLAKKCQDPHQALPVMAGFSRLQNTGKSATLYRAPGLLFDIGATNLTRSYAENFNGSLHGALWGYVSERPLTQREYVQVKESVDEDCLFIRTMRSNEFKAANTCCQQFTGNTLPEHLEPTDERFVVFMLYPVLGGLRPWQSILRPGLLRELPAVTHALLTHPLPKSKAGDDRLYMPVINTPLKQFLQGRCEYPLAAQIIDWQPGNEWAGSVDNLYEALKPWQTPDEFAKALAKLKGELSNKWSPKSGVVLKLTKKDVHISWEPA